ncbi:MAG: OmpA family protein [Cyclobacteriaceae bacterium]|nr:OmpA family protein [Cyclobacteriaceae bacterium]
MRFVFCLSLLACSFVCVGQSVFTASSFALVNTTYDEQNPVVSPDGRTLYFTVSNHPQNVGGQRDPGDIWVSQWLGNGWSAPVHAGPTLNNRGYNAVAGFSSDGMRLYLLSHYDPSGEVRTQGISVSRKSGAGWTNPENIYIPYFQNKSSIQSGHITADERVFVYSAETYGTHGVEDIYISIKGNDGKWGEPRNLGSKINTQFQELSPSLSADGSTLYFSSNGRKQGMGSFDIYYSTRLDDSYHNWSEPVNLGTSFNSTGRELFFRSFEMLGYSLFTSTTNSDGYGDIRYFIPEKRDSSLFAVAPQDTLIKIQEQKYEDVIGENEVRIFGKVLNASNDQPVQANLKFTASSESYPATAQYSQGYSIKVPSTQSYTLEVTAPGYISSFEKLDLHTLELKELEMNFRLQPIEVGVSVNLKSVLFVQSKPALLPESYQELDVVVAFMQANPHVEIELSGHTDSRGSFRQLMELSQQRVNRVKEYLVSKGIDKKRISGKGYGGSKPVASNDTEEGRMLNRRVEFTIKKN